VAETGIRLDYATATKRPYMWIPYTTAARADGTTASGGMTTTHQKKWGTVMPTTTATTTTPPTDTDPHAPAPDTAAPDTAVPDTVGHAADSREAHAADGPAGDSPARVARAGDVEDRVWAALRRHPGATAAELATEASASRSAVGKLLAAWAADGSATSTPGSKPRAARLWTAAPNHDAPTTEPSTESATTADTAEPEDNRADEAATRTSDPVARPDAVNAETADSIRQAHPGSGSGHKTGDAEDDSFRDCASHAAGAAAGEASSEGDPYRGAGREDEAAPDGAKAGGPRAAADRLGEAHNGEAHNDEADDAEVDAEADAGTDTEVDDTERDGTAAAGSEDGASAAGAERATGRGPGRPRPPTRNRAGSTRLAKGALRGQVEDYLAETPGEHSPVEIGKVLGRSSGAIANALEALVESGDAVRTSDRPRRYSHSDHADDVESNGSGSGSVRDGAARGRTRTRGPGRGVSGVGTYVTVLAVVPLDSTGAISTDEIADWIRARMPEPVLFASAAHGVTRAALSAGADPSDWPTTTTDGTTTDGATADDTAAEGATTDDAAADPTAGGEGEPPQPRTESGVGA
jgi:hypothetical protein